VNKPARKYYKGGDLLTVEFIIIIIIIYFATE